jgi:type VI secretion system protein ImpL
VLKYKWLIELVGLLALALLLWFLGPLVAIAGAVPLESVLSRGLSILLVIVLWLLWWGSRQYKAKQQEAKLIAGLSATADAGAANENAVNAELTGLKQGFEAAMALLKSTAQKKQRGQQYLYELPWYAIVGTPGSGKTTALINSGLHFPLAEPLGHYSLKGVSGTRDCDWWFADEAVLLDTAGRYVSQDSHQEVDASAWLGFLELLKKYRPRRPLNGVFVALSLPDLMQQTEAQLAQHAHLIRQRILELNSRLGVQLPIYVLLTKTDLLAGFNDFFANLTEEERAQVWGRTFSGGQALSVSDNLNEFAKDYDDLVLRLNQRRLRRIQEERDVQRRSAIFDFPTQIHLLKSQLLTFLEMAFSANRYETEFLLRGVYFTSGTQQGTPIDRVMAALAAAYRLDRVAPTQVSGRGKSYFLTRLLKQVVFPEAELVGVDAKLEQRFQALRLGGYLAASVLLLSVIVAWLVSFTANSNALSQVETQIALFQANNPSSAYPPQQAVLAVLPRLNALLAARTVFPETEWASGFGLYQGDKIDAGVNVAYRQLLSNAFAPLLVQRLQQRIQGAEGNNLEVLYQLFRVYLMLVEPEHRDANTVKAWLKLDWQQSFATDPATQAQLQAHLDNLLMLPLAPMAADANFVASVRARLQQTPLAIQLYGQFKNEALLDHEHDLHLAEQLNPNGGRVYSANGKDLESVQVPGLFTAYGYTEVFLKNSKAYVMEASGQTWVLGKAVDNLAETERLYGDFLRLYLADYQKQWDGVITSLNIRPQQTNNQLIDTLDLLSRPDSPLKLLLQTLAKNTSLTQLAAATAANPVTQGLAAVTGQIPDALSQKALALAKPQSTDSSTDPVKALEAYFAPYNQQVLALPDRPAPIEASMAALKNLHDYLLQVSNAPDKKASILPGGALSPLQSAKLDFARLPEKLAASLENLTRTGGSNIKTDAKAQLNSFLKTSVDIPCNSALAGRYPFTKNAQQEVLMADFIKIFSANGVVEQYFNNHLKGLVDTSAAIWQELPGDNSLGLSAVALKQFQLAAKIREAFFPGAASKPQVDFELKPLSLDDKVGTFRLNIEGQELVYQHGPELSTQFKWPGINSSAGVRLVFETLEGKQVSRFKEGAWALFKMLDDFNIERTALPDRFNLTVKLDGLVARFELRAASVNNPFALTEYQAFRCPELL